MPDNFQNPLQAVPLTTDQLYLVLGALAGIILLIFSFREQIFNWREERRLKRAIKRLGARALRDIRLTDGMGGEVTIDYLLLSTDAVLVVGVKRFSGLIFGGVQTDQWTQVINRCSYKFPNPDDYLQRQVEAVRLLIPGTAVTGIHLFTHGATFPKGKPDNVLLSREIRQKAPKLRRIPKALRDAWDRLMQSVVSQRDTT
jgi:hypothetical protein